MAFYKDAPNRHPHKTNYANTGSWDDEGTHYTGARKGQGDRRQEGYRAHNNDRFEKREGYRSDRRERNEGSRGYGRPQEGERRFGPKKNGGFDHNSNNRNGGFKGNDRPRNNRFDRNDGFRKEESAAPSFRDFEYTAPVVAPAPAQPIFRQPVEVPENLLSGRNPIREALKSGRDIDKLLVQRGEQSGSAREIVQMARERRIVVQEVEKSRLDEITPNHQGLLAYASAYQYSTVEAMLAEAEAKGEDPFLILLDGVTDPHNLGAIIRSAECVGAHGVIVPERRSVGLTPAAVKSSAGAVEHMKVARVTNLNRTIEELKQRNIWTYAVTMDGEDYLTTNFKGGVALVIGAEGEGISRLTLENCDCKVSLPMAGHIDSLNASVAAGVMMYRVLASRKA